MARLFSCGHVHASGRRCSITLPYYGRCPAHEVGRTCSDCLAMLAAFPKRDGSRLAGL